MKISHSSNDVVVEHCAALCSSYFFRSFIQQRAGINHKTYAVTSTGVNVFLDVALQRVLDIDPRSNSFTVKITGGPDGDVAGNEIKILLREYDENAKIVGIADHSGCAEDPDGLNHEELLRLVNESKCISHFASSKLGPSGVLHTVDTEQGIKQRNSMHNRLVADAFLPCGYVHTYSSLLLLHGLLDCNIFV